VAGFSYENRAHLVIDRHIVPSDDVVLIPAVRHQLEAGYKEE
jgi:hypothetical protein